MANWFPSIWKAICTTRSWKNDEKRRYFYADMGIAVCPLSNSRTFWPFELTSDRRVSPILPISTLPSPNQENIHKLRWKGIFINDVGPFLCPFCALSVAFLCPFCELSTIWKVSDMCPMSCPCLHYRHQTKRTFMNYVERALSKRWILSIWKHWSAKILLSKWFFYVKNHLNFSFI